MMKRLGQIVTDKPGITLVVVLTLSMIMIGITISPKSFGLEQDNTQREQDWVPNNDETKADQEIKDNYGIQARYLQLVVKGKDGNVLTKDALMDILSVEKTISENPTVQEVLFPYQGNISSISSAISWMMLTQQGLATEDINYDMMLGALNATNQTTIDMIISAAGPNLAMFLSSDFMENLNETGEVKAKGTMILVMLNSEKYDEIDTAEDYNPILDADEEVLNIVDGAEFKGVSRMGLIEGEYIGREMNEESGGAMAELFGYVFLLIIIILFATYRSFFDTLISIMALMFAISWMNGVGILLGLNFSMIATAVPIMLLGLGIDYAIHLVIRYREGRTHDGEDVKGALILTEVTVGASIFLATLTTALSFGSNTVSEIPPMRDFAIFAFVGISSAFIIMVTFIPASKMLFHTHLEPKIDAILEPYTRKFKESIPWPGKKKLQTSKGASGVKGEKRSKSSADDPLASFLAKGAIAAEHHAHAVIVGIVTISLICAGLATQLDTEFDFTEFLPEGAEVTEDILYLQDNFDFGTEEADILVKGKMDDPALLLAMRETEQNILNNSDVNEQDPIESVLTLMEDVALGTEDRAANPVFALLFNASDLNGDLVPDQNITLLFDELRTSANHSSALARVLHYDLETREYDGAVIRVGVNSQNGGRSENIQSDMNDNIRPLERILGDEKVTATGAPILTHVIIKSIELTGIQSLIITILMAAVILGAVFYLKERSIVLGLITEIPVVLVIAWVFASMYFLDMSLNVMTIMIASLTVGIGVDYAIHITHRFVEDLKEFGSIDEACKSTVIHTGTALFGAAITTVGGFGILILAPIPPLRMFGAISALSVSFSFISSVFVLPTFLTVWAQHKQKKDPGFLQEHRAVKEEVNTDAVNYPSPGVGGKPEEEKETQEQENKGENQEESARDGEEIPISPGSGEETGPRQQHEERKTEDSRDPGEKKRGIYPFKKPDDKTNPGPLVDL